ncbi:MAG: HlyD family efflux transporter periplasmic adaptor subunit [Bacteroidetes bacterium]|nr:HlyD family efflux transporter periplasmic adaptor subunit [Bacteroidota bacterium]
MHPFISSSIESSLENTKLRSYRTIYHIEKTSRIKKWVIGSLLILLIILFLPWTQNIRATGSVTTLQQDQRPQEVNSIIAGSVVKWYVKEGDFVKEGDTLLQLGEVKTDYFDPQLLNRTQEQVVAKQKSILNYNNKATTAQTQVTALKNGLALKLNSIDNKLQQQYLKVASDSNDLIAAQNELNIYRRQLEAGKIMYDSGSIALIELEKRRANFQNGQAKKISIENKFLQNKQEIANLQIEKRSALQEYADKIAKAEGDAFSAISDAAGTEAEVAKLRNLYANFDARNKLYYVRAPQNGQITKAKKAGIGEMMKEGDMLVEIVPNEVEHAVQLYIDPMDLPLISKGQKVRFIFDGFPAIVFSGWPKGSIGTFGGKVAAIETNVSTNGKFRVLIKEDDPNRPWPKQLRMGGGAKGIALLKDVRVYYELWRIINGFPPEYYQSEINTNNGGKKK